MRKWTVSPRLILALVLLSTLVSYIHFGWDFSRSKVNEVLTTYWPTEVLETATSEAADNSSVPAAENTVPTLPLEVSTPGPDDHTATGRTLRELCDNTTWIDGLWLHCHGRGKLDEEGKSTFSGGLNNVRGRLQTCIRLAINAGAGVVIPTIASRDQAHLKNLGGGDLVPASRYWNTEFLGESLQRECPQLRMRFDLHGIDQERRVLGRTRHWKNSRYHDNGFRQEVFAYLQKASVTDVSRSNPASLSFGDTFLGWDYKLSGELATVRKDLFRTIAYNETLMEIGSQIRASPQLQRGYVGVHLRGERDWPNGFGNWRKQMNFYTEEITSLNRRLSLNITTIYVSCGNATVIDIFRKRLSLLGYSVHDKWSLLGNNPAMLARIEALLFDQKAAIEYTTLFNSAFFMGPFMSSMSQLIAYAREINSTKDFFEQYIYPGSRQLPGDSGLEMVRKYPKVPIMKGSNTTKLMVVNGDDIMSFFP